jgi:hypothetical protein
MATATQKAPDATALDDVRAAFEKRREQAQRLSDQDRYIGSLVRAARKAGHTWQRIADAAGTSDVAVIKAARRPEKAA